MDSGSSHIDFALIGHQDSWKNVSAFVNHLRKSSAENILSHQQLAEVYSYLPPRPLFDIEVKSTTGNVVRGKYIETFIAPDELNVKYWKSNISKVKEAAAWAAKLNAGVAALGGFTSIVLEGKVDGLNGSTATNFTTGNTLTAAFIVKSIEKACNLYDKELCHQTILVIGSTGDIGSACVKYFSGRVRKLLLCARQQNLLEAQQQQISAEQMDVRSSIDLATLLPEADIVIAIASSMIENFDANLCKKEVIICDAGYPKNLDGRFPACIAEKTFCGGMGVVTGGYSYTPGFSKAFYQFPEKNIGHGCLLEAIVLALEKEPVAYSTGKGNITTRKIESIYAAARKHGITEAPFFNASGLWD